jgi:hypothetical protein
MFESKFIEGQTQSVDMEEIEGVVSTTSMGGLIQWLYHRRVRFDKEPEDQITAAIELSRLADMCNVKELEAEMALFIKNVIIANRKSEKAKCADFKNLNTHSINEDHINSAAFLPRGHAVRRILAVASVEGFFKGKNYKFAQQAQDIPTIGADLLEEVRCTLSKPKASAGSSFIMDPITGDISPINYYQ